MRKGALRPPPRGHGVTFCFWVLCPFNPTPLNSASHGAQLLDGPLGREADFLTSSCESCTTARRTLEYLYLTFLPARAGRTTARAHFVGQFLCYKSISFFVVKLKK